MKGILQASRLCAHFGRPRLLLAVPEADIHIVWLYAHALIDRMRAIGALEAARAKNEGPP
jgi:hypothetical protein